MLIIVKNMSIVARFIQALSDVEKTPGLVSEMVNAPCVLFVIKMAKWEAGFHAAICNSPRMAHCASTMRRSVAL